MSRSVAASRAAAAHGAPSTDPTGTFGISTGTRPPERDRYAREYVPRSELPRVRRWIRRARAETAFGWGQAGLVRRVFASVEKARLKRADTDTAQGAANAAEPAGGARSGKSPASRRRLRPLRGEVKPRRRREPVGPALRTLPAVSQATVPLETAAKPRTADYAYYVSRGVLRGLLLDQPDSGMRRAASYAVRRREPLREDERLTPAVPRQCGDLVIRPADEADTVEIIEAFRVCRDLEPFRRDVDGDVGDALPTAPGRMALQAVPNVRGEVVADDPAPLGSSEGHQVGALDFARVDVVDDDGLSVGERLGDQLSWRWSRFRTLRIRSLLTWRCVAAKCVRKKVLLPDAGRPTKITKARSALARRGSG